MQRSRGYSLYDFLVTLAIGGILAIGAAGALRAVRGITQTTEINAFVSQLNLARSVAITRQRSVVFCPSKDGRRCSAADAFTWWHDGALLFVDDNGNREVDAADVVVRHYASVDPQLRIKTSRARSRVVYQPDGFAGGSNLTFTFCVRRESANAKARYVVISNTGRARVAATPASGKAETCI
ncbi:MAG TPA: GspH/FimT family pseudopilin [Burkholderiales bacterium]|nr:GspH/FimT family pseudopilin [Burkholderiales bacterium]